MFKSLKYGNILNTEELPFRIKFMFRRKGLKISVNRTYASLKKRNIKRHLHFVIIIAYNIQVIGKLSPSMLFAVSNFLKTYRGKNR